MVAPIVSLPAKTTLVGSGPGSKYIYQTNRSKQAAPFTIPTRYTCIAAYVLAAENTGEAKGWPWASFQQPNFFGTYSCSPTQNSVVASSIGDAVNKARAKALAQISERAMTAVNLAERAQAARMISKRLRDCYNLLQWVKRSSAEVAAAQIRVAYMQRNQNRQEKLLSNLEKYNRLENRARKRLVGAASSWLEWHFGWEPLMKDIYALSKILVEVPPLAPISIGASDTRNFEYHDNTWDIHGIVKCSCRIGCSIEVIDYDLARMNFAGLTNPVAVAYELVPYSFLLDWFTSVGQFLESLNDTAGLRIVKPYYTTRVKGLVDVRNYPAADGGKRAVRTSQRSENFLERYPDFPSVQLKIRGLKPLGLERSLTAASLLALQLKRG